MSKNYIELSWNEHLDTDEAEILISLLNELGFDSYFEDEGVFRAYVEKSIFNHDLMMNMLQNVTFSINITEYQIKEVPQKNWNEVWESEFSPVEIGDFLTIKAPFHNIETKSDFEIVIEPKMSFGTGHHETTSGMLEMMHELDFKGKSVIDMGSGTGILSVFAEKLGATSLIAIDNDPICIENSKEIFDLNKCKSIKLVLGDASALNGLHCDILLANINRNILLNYIKEYRKALSKDGLLMMSGFYAHDLGMIDEECKAHGFESIKVSTKNEWIVCLYKVI